MNQKILHIAPTPFFSDRGCHIRIEGIVNCLDALAYDNWVCTYHHGRDVKSVKTKRIKTIKNYTQTEAGPSKYKLWADWRLLILTLKEVYQSHPNTLHAHLHEGLLIGIIVKILCFWRRMHLIADMQGSLTGELAEHGVFEKYKFLRWPTKTLERVLMWFPDAIICSSKHSLEKLKDEFKIPQDKISLVQDGAKEPSRLTSEQRQLKKAELGLDKDKVIAVYSGALLESKGLAELKTLIEASQHSENLHFLIIGYPVENIETFLIENNLTARCTLLGQVDFEELPVLLQSCDIGIDPKYSDAGEGSGKMLNYLACGLPVVAYNTENNRDFLPSNIKLAIDDDDLVQLLKIYLHNPDERERFTNLALEHFRLNFSWDKTRHQLERVYTALS